MKVCFFVLEPWAALGLLALAAGCAFNPFLPDLRTAKDRAKEIAPRCAHRSEAGDAAALSPAAVEAVEAAYSHVPSGNERMPRLRGATLSLRPEASSSAESLQRSLECHEARVLLGASAPLDSDPYFLPGTWLDIGAESTGDGLRVAVGVNDYEKAQQVLARAQRFASTRLK